MISTSRSLSSVMPCAIPYAIQDDGTYDRDHGECSNGTVSPQQRFEKGWFILTHLFVAPFSLLTLSTNQFSKELPYSQQLKGTCGTDVASMWYNIQNIIVCG